MTKDEKLKSIIQKILHLEYENEKNRMFSDESMILKIKKWIEEETNETEEN